VTNKYLRVIALALMAALVLAACGGDDGGGDDTDVQAEEDAGGETVSVDQYAGDVCAALSAWVTDIQDRASTITEGIDPGDAEAGKERLEEFIGDTVDGTDELIASVEDAGVPDTDGGEEAAEQIQTGLEQVKTILEDAQDQIADLPTNDPQAFGTGAQEIATSLQEATGEAAGAIDSANSEELTAAFGENEDCAQYSGASS
jgi:hypothetical protein